MLHRNLTEETDKKNQPPPFILDATIQPLTFHLFPYQPRHFPLPSLRYPAPFLNIPRHVFTRQQLPAGRHPPSTNVSNSKTGAVRAQFSNPLRHRSTQM